VLADGRAQATPAGDRPGGGLLVNVSRAIAAEALATVDPAEAIRTAAADWARRLPVLP
jgi:orotidine-5'-phosphate decarboxylase